jgi:glutathione synthase/RimK-type ligase-like ATP-grasp enzyme
MAKPLMNRLTQAQREINATLSREMRAVRQGSPGAALAVIGIAFLYGILHAAGPGHGKLIVSSFFLARDTRLLTGLFAGVLFSLLQAVSSIALVAVLALALEWGGLRSAGPVRPAGARELRAHRGDRLYLTASALRDGHHHGQSEGRPARRPSSLWSVVTAAGLTPCASAIIILLFAWANHVFALGIGATLVMALGMAITVCAMGSPPSARDAPSCAPPGEARAVPLGPARAFRHRRRPHHHIRVSAVRRCVGAPAVTTFSPRVCFVSCTAWPGVSESDGFAQRALEARGAILEARPWNAPDARFDGFDVVVFRSNWDYHHDPDAFLAWLASWEAAGVRFWNPPGLIRWNLSKRYLLELAAAGIPVVPSVVLDDGDVARLPVVMAERGWDTAVVKPVLSASAHDTTLVPASEAVAVARGVAEGRIRCPVMVQPFVSEIRAAASGHSSSSTRLHPRRAQAPQRGRLPSAAALGGRAAAARPDAATLAVARRTLDALPVSPLYARIDGVLTDAGFVIMEVEVHEPGLFFTLAPDAAAAFAAAILRRV